MKHKLRLEAKGRECQIRIPDVCNGNSETVVLCHLNNKGMFNAGTGMKSSDIFAAWGCSACHDVVDNRASWDDASGYFSPQEIQAMFYEGVFRTQNILLNEGKIGEIA